MNLLVLMYHRARACRHGNSADLLDAHFAYLAGRYHSVLPGDALTDDRLNVCVTFDDAYFDFHAIVFPLLQKHRLRALVAVVPNVTCERVDASAAQRLALEADAAFAHPEAGGFCTWDELADVVRSGHVRVAAHGQTHVRLDRDDADLATEVDQPQAVLAARLGQPVDSFVFPYGRYSRLALARAKARYAHVFRIGGAMNAGWNGRVLYRVDADGMESPDALFRPGKLTAYCARHWWNRLRGR